MERCGNGGLRITVASRAYAASIARIYAPFVLHTPVSFEEVPPSDEEMAHKIEETLRTHPWLVALVGDEVAGFAYACPHRVRAAYRWSVDVSVYVDPEFHRQGIAKALYGELFRILIDQGFFNAYAGITQPNAASVALHEAVGFRPVGMYEEVGYKHGAWHTVGWWQLALQDRAPDPTEPIPFARSRRTATEDDKER